MKLHRPLQWHAAIDLQERRREERFAFPFDRNLAVELAFNLWNVYTTRE